MNTTTKNYLKIGLAGALWGTLGLFGKTLEGYQMSPPMISFARLFSGLAIMLLYFGIKNPSVLKIDKKGLWSCMIIGVISQGFFNLAYFSSIQLVGAFTAVVLLYFSIIFMFLMGTLIYKEKPSSKKITAIILCLVGCVFGATGGDFSALQANTKGIVMGLLAAFSYSLMPTISKKTSVTYNPFTIIIYSFLFGALFLIPFAKPWTFFDTPREPQIYLVILLFGLVASTLPYGLYIPSLHNIQISKLGVITSIELVVSIIIAALWLKESINIYKLLGGAIIMFSIWLMNTNFDIRQPITKKRRSIRE